jgi:hypothetical protein
MKIERVAKLSPESRFLYWIKERHAIYLRREAGEEKPWTDDEMLQRYFFTNPYRENDKTTVWFRENVREPWRDLLQVILATVIFRWFNYIPTGKRLLSNKLLESWNGFRCERLLRNGPKVFTGAFMINSPPGKKKLEAVCERITNVWKDRHSLVAFLDLGGASLQQAHERLLVYPGLGGFMAYEVVCDLRYTRFLKHAVDKLTWCNPGPGCIRGLYRIAEEEIENKGNSISPPKPKNWQDQMQRLLHLVQSELKGMPPFEMREVEHSLCEWDKYERARLGDGRLKRLYQGV